MEKSILVVDDEQSIRDLFYQSFQNIGYRVLTAAGGAEALQILGREDVRVMFLDIKMPEMDGVHLCKEIRKNQPDACIYALSGYVMLFPLGTYTEAGFDDFFLKPIDLGRAFQTVETAFERLGNLATDIADT